METDSENNTSQYNLKNRIRGYLSPIIDKLGYFSETVKVDYHGKEIELPRWKRWLNAFRHFSRSAYISSSRTLEEKLKIKTEEVNKKLAEKEEVHKKEIDEEKAKTVAAESRVSELTCKLEKGNNAWAELDGEHRKELHDEKTNRASAEKRAEELNKGLEQEKHKNQGLEAKIKETEEDLSVKTHRFNLAEEILMRLDADYRNELIGLRIDLSQLKTALQKSEKNYSELAKKLADVSVQIQVHEEFERGFEEVMEFHRKTKKNIDKLAAAKSYLFLLRHQRKLVKEATAIIYSKDEEVAKTLAKKDREILEAKRQYALARANIFLAKDIILLYLDSSDKNKILAMSAAAKEAYGQNLIGKTGDSILEGLDKMIKRIRITKEPRFYLENVPIAAGSNSTLEVYLDREGSNYFGSFLVFGQKPTGFINRMLHSKTYEEQLEDAVSQSVDERKGAKASSSALNLSKAKPEEISEELGQRLYSLSQSLYFGSRIRVIIGNNSPVYNELNKKHHIPYKMMVTTFEILENTEKVVNREQLEGEAKIEGA